MSIPLFVEDLTHTLEHCRSAFDDLRGASIFATGGTGFFGRWLLETFQHANRSLDLGATITVLSRNPAAFLRDMPHLAGDGSIRFCVGDLMTGQFPEGEFSHVIHAATETNADHSPPAPIALFDTAVIGTRRVLEFARAHGTRRLLYTSSGAVYGPQPSDVTHVPESLSIAPYTTDVNLAYGHGKRAAEFLCHAYAERYGMACVSARCFAFVGPHLPLDLGFAIGNFIRDARRGGPISVNGDGTPHRSYLYAADLAAWLWSLLTRGASGRAYNVGSEQSVTIAELAQLVTAVVNQRCEVRILEQARPEQPARRYVPSTDRARRELGLQVWVALEEAIARTTKWLEAGTPNLLR